MSLSDKLTAIRDGAVKQLPADKLAMMQAATAALRRSGIMERVIKVGDTLPAFNLMTARGAARSSTSLLHQGPVVLTIFRGHW